MEVYKTKEPVPVSDICEHIEVRVGYSTDFYQGDGQERDSKEFLGKRCGFYQRFTLNHPAKGVVGTLVQTSKMVDLNTRNSYAIVDDEHQVHEINADGVLYYPFST